VVEVRDLDYPKLEVEAQKRKCHHGVILKASLRQALKLT
jgi:hypothetical protein